MEQQLQGLINQPSCYLVTTSNLWLERPPPPSYSAGLGNVSRPLSAGRLSTTVDSKTEGRCRRSTWRNCDQTQQLLTAQAGDPVTPVLGWSVEVLLYVHRNRGFIRDGSPERPPRLSHSSWALHTRPLMMMMMMIDWLIDDRLYSAILRSLEQTHFARMWCYMSD